MTEILHESRLLEESYREIRHRSGLRLFLFPRDTATHQAVLTVRYGGMDVCFRTDRNKTPINCPPGCAHFIEHKLFSNEDGTDAMEQFAELGANANAMTSADETTFIFSTAENQLACLRVLLSFVTHPYFTEENLASERDIIAEEIAMYEDSPQEQLYSSLMRGLYRSHPIREDVAGSRESIGKITPELLYCCYRTFYRPDCMMLALEGRFALEQVLPLLDEYFPSQPPAFPLPERIFPEEPSAASVPYSEQHADTQIPIVGIGFRYPFLPGNGDEQMKLTETMNLLTDILFSHTSPFFNTLYREGLVDDRFASDFECTSSFAYILLTAATEQPEELVRRVREFLDESAKKHDITERELERCKRVMYAGTVLSFESVGTIPEDCISLAMNDGELFRQTDLMLSLTLSDLFSVLDRAFDPRLQTISLVLPCAHPDAALFPQQNQSNGKDEIL